MLYQHLPPFVPERACELRLLPGKSSIAAVLIPSWCVPEMGFGYPWVQTAVVLCGFVGFCMYLYGFVWFCVVEIYSVCK